MRVYNSIPTEIKPIVGVAKLRYEEAFDNEFYLLLRERKSDNLPDMFKYALEVESNSMESGKMKKRVEVDRRKMREENQPSTSDSYSNDAKFEMMMKTMEILMDMLDLDNIPPNREQHEPKIRNPKFRRLVLPLKLGRET